jgi:outer membrane protein W
MKIVQLRSASLLLLLLSVYPAEAQQIFGLTYDISFPVSKTATLVNTTSIIGFGLDGRQMMNRNVSFGVTFHWNSFKDERMELADSGGDVSASVSDRSLESYPLLLSAHYYFVSDEMIFTPFLGGNAGTYFVIARKTVDGIRQVNKGWQFGIAPDIGFMLEFMDDINIMLTLRYNLAAASANAERLSYWSVIFGFVSVSLF